jgi:hypothetical protein
MLVKNLEPSTRHKLIIAFTFLFCLSFGTAAGALFISLNTITARNHTFCEVITPALSTLKSQVPKDPAALKNPKVREVAEWYLRYQHLSEHLGC